MSDQTPPEFDRAAYLSKPNCAQSAVAIIPDTPLTSPSRGLYVGVGGNANVTMADGTTVLFVGLIDGLIYPLSIQGISSTDLTADNLVATY
jgi:hypothetical protein